MPFNYKLIGIVKQSALRLNAKTADWNPLTWFSGKKPAPPAPYSPELPTAASPEHQPPVVGQLYGASPGAKLDITKIPKRFNTNYPVLNHLAREVYDTSGSSARMRNHQAINSNIRDPLAYRNESLGLANQGLANRSGTPWQLDRSTEPSTAEVALDPKYSRKINVHNSDWYHKSPPYKPVSGMFKTPLGVTLAHEGTHTGEQANFQDRSVSNFKHVWLPHLNRELPAVLSEHANSAQAAWLAKNMKAPRNPVKIKPGSSEYDYGAAYAPKIEPLSGTFSLGGRPVPLEIVRKYLESHGHTGGDYKTTMTDLINSPDGQTFLEGHMRDIERDPNFGVLP